MKILTREIILCIIMLVLLPSAYAELTPDELRVNQDVLDAANTVLGFSQLHDRVSINGLTPGQTFKIQQAFSGNSQLPSAETRDFAFQAVVDQIIGVTSKVMTGHTPYDDFSSDQPAPDRGTELGIPHVWNEKSYNKAFGDPELEDILVSIRAEEVLNSHLQPNIAPEDRKLGASSRMVEYFKETEFFKNWENMNLPLGEDYDYGPAHSFRAQNVLSDFTSYDVNGAFSVQGPQPNIMYDLYAGNYVNWEYEYGPQPQSFYYIQFNYVTPDYGWSTFLNSIGYQSMSYGDSIGDPSATGPDPHTNTIEADYADSRKQYFDLYGIGYDVALHSKLGANTYSFCFDNVHQHPNQTWKNRNGICDDGVELAFSETRNIFELYEMLDSNADGRLNEKDTIWQDILLTDSDFESIPISEFTFEEAQIIEIIYEYPKCFGDDQYGKGRYMDEVWNGKERYSDHHFRALCMKADSVQFDNGNSWDLYATVQGGIYEECTVHDAEYGRAEYFQRNSIIQPEFLGLSIEIYSFMLDKCLKSPYNYTEKELAHWFAGVCSAMDRGILLGIYSERLAPKTEECYYRSLALNTNEKVIEDLYLFQKRIN